MLVAFKLNAGVHDVLQYFRTGQCAFLVDVSYENHGHTTGLGKTKERCGAFPHLGDTARRTVHLIGGNRLDGVYNDNFGLDLFDVLENFLQ